MTDRELTDDEVFGVSPTDGEPVEMSDEDVFGPEAVEDGGAARAGAMIGGNLSRGLIANLGGFPVDAVNAALSTIGLGSEEPFGGSKSINRGLDKVIGPTPEARDGTERIIARTAQELGASVLPIGATLRAAKAGTQAVAPLLRPLVEGAAASPGRYVAGEAAAAAGAGAGAGLAREAIGAGEDDSWRGQIADLVGAIAGGLGPAGIAELARAVNRHVPVTQGAKEAAAARNLNLKAEDSIRLGEAEEVAPAIPGADFAPAELLDDPRLLAEKKRLDVSSPEAVQAETTRRAQNNQALAGFAEAQAPVGDVEAPRAAVARQRGTVEGRLGEAEAGAQEAGARAVAGAEEEAAAAVDTARTAAADRAARLQEEGDAAIEGARSAAAERLATQQARDAEALGALGGDVDAALGEAGRSPDIRKADASRVAREEIEAAQDEAEKQASRLFKAADPDGTLTIETGRLSQVVDDISEEAISRGREDAIPDLISSGTITGYLGEQPLQRLNGLRSMLGEQIRAEQRAGNRQKASFLIQLQRGVDDALEAEIDDQISAKMAVGETNTARNLERERDLWLSERQAARASGLDLRTGTERESVGLAGGSQSVGERGAPNGRLDDDPSRATSAETGGRSGSGSRPSTQADREGAASALRAARSFFRDNVAQTFRQGRVGKTLKVGSDNRPAVAPEKTLGQFTVDEGALNDFTKAIGGRPAAVQAMQDYAMSDMVQYATDTAGKIVPRKVAAWRQKYAPILRAFPEVDKFTGNIQKLQERVTAAEKAAADAAKATEREGREAVRSTERGARDATRQAEREGRAEVRSAERLGRQAVKVATATAKEEAGKAAGRKKRSLGAIEKSAAQFWLDRTPEKAVSGILSSGNPAQAAKETMVMVRKGGGQEAADGVSRAAWDVVVNRIFSNVEDGGIKPAIGAKFLKDNEAPLRILLGPEKLAKAQEMLKAGQINARAGKAVAGSGSDTVQKAALPKIAYDAAKQSASILGGIMTGQALGGPIGALVGGVVGKSAELFAMRQRHAVQELMREALNDPATFRLLTTRITRDNEEAIARALKAKMASFGIRQGAAAESSDDD